MGVSERQLAARRVYRLAFTDVADAEGLSILSPVVSPGYHCEFTCPAIRAARTMRGETGQRQLTKTAQPESPVFQPHRTQRGVRLSAALRNAPPSPVPNGRFLVWKLMQRVELPVSQGGEKIPTPSLPSTGPFT